MLHTKGRGLRAPDAPFEIVGVTGVTHAHPTGLRETRPRDLAEVRQPRLTLPGHAPIIAIRSAGSRTSKQ